MPPAAFTRDMLKPVELEIELFCRGMRIDASCRVGDEGRRISRTRAGLGSGLEIVIPAKPKDIFTVTSEDGRAIRYYSIWFQAAVPTK